MRVAAILHGICILPNDVFQPVLSLSTFRKGRVRPQQAFPRNQYFIQFDTSEEMDSKESLLSDFSVVYEFPSLNTVVVNATNEELSTLSTSVIVKKDQPRSPTTDETEPIVTVLETGGRLLSDDLVEYNMDQIQIPLAHELTKGAGVTVCIIDSGVAEHEDLDASKISGSNTKFPWEEDLVGHGTYMTGIIAAISDNSVGIVGVAPDADIYVVRVFRESGQYFEYSSDIVDAIFQCVARGAKVINMSLGGVGLQEFEELWLANIVAEYGVLLVAAAGNGGPTAPKSYPASYTSVLSVAATDSAHDWWPKSQVNEFVDIAAPGVRVKSTLNKSNGFEYRNGTSVACAHVSGVAALLWSYKPEATLTEIRAALLNTAKDIGIDGRDNFFGNGLVQAMDALEYLQNPPSLPPVSTTPVPTPSPTWPGQPSTALTLEPSLILMHPPQYIAKTGSPSGMLMPTLPPVSTAPPPIAPSSGGGSPSVFPMPTLAPVPGGPPPTLGPTSASVPSWSVPTSGPTSASAPSLSAPTSASAPSLSAPTSASGPSWSVPTSGPTSVSVPSLSVACRFIQEPVVEECSSRTSVSLAVEGTTIPTEIGLLTRLTSLDLSKQGLTGRMPSNLGNLTRLARLLLFNNQLTDIIPLSFERLSELEKLDISNNLLTGSIPSVLGSLEKLTALYLNNNALTSSIPESMGMLTQLTSFWLNGNSLTGSLPIDPDNMVQLKQLFLYNNDLTGSIPSSFCSINSIDISVDCWDIQCECCVSNWPSLVSCL